MNIRIVVAVVLPQQIRPGKLNDTLKAAGFAFSAFHNAAEVIVECGDADEAAIRAVVASHLETDWDSIDAAQAKIDAEERKVGMPRWARELYLAVGQDTAFKAKVRAVEDAVSVERGALADVGEAVKK